MLNGRGVTSAFGIAISGDGNHVYVAATNGGSVAIFTRLDADGQLAQAANGSGCWSDTGLDFPGGNASTPANAQAPLAGAENAWPCRPTAGTCTSRQTMPSPRSAATRAAACSADRPAPIAASARTGSGGSARTATRCSTPCRWTSARTAISTWPRPARTCPIDILHRDPVTGGLSQQAGMAGCISEGAAAAAPRRGPRPAVRRRHRQSDGANVYATAFVSMTVSAFA